MDAPPIRYAKTADGVNIAFWTPGEGPPCRRRPRPLEKRFAGIRP